MPLIVVMTIVFGFLAVGRTADSLVVSCREFGRDLSAEELASRFGSANVTNGPVNVGEGFSEPGTVLYRDLPEQRAEFTWKDVAAKRRLKVLRIHGVKTEWRSPQGLTLGLELSRVERLNRKPFRLLGFGWDYGGTTTNWAGGSLAQAESPDCVLWTRFLEPEETRLGPEQLRLMRQVYGEREFSSGHPGMQISGARIRIMGLQWR